MKNTLRLGCAALLAAALLAASLLPPAVADEKEKEKDIFNYAAQKAAGKGVKKIVFIADTRPHGPRGNHEFVAGAIYLARTINAALSQRLRRRPHAGPAGPRTCRTPTPSSSC